VINAGTGADREINTISIQIPHATYPKISVSKAKFVSYKEKDFSVYQSIQIGCGAFPSFYSIGTSSFPQE
jgi:hypothetical protein